jgi:hypothetical protein
VVKPLRLGAGVFGAARLAEGRVRQVRRIRGVEMIQRRVRAFARNVGVLPAPVAPG